MIRKSPTGPQSFDAGNPIEPLAVSISEAGRIIGIKRSSIYREIAAGRLTAVKANKRRLLTMEALRAWLAALPQSKAA